MNEHLFDQYFRNKLHDHQADVPADMWSRIIQEKPDRRPFLFWFNNKLGILLTAILLTSSLTYLFYPNVIALVQNQSSSSTTDKTSVQQPLQQKNEQTSNISEKPLAVDATATSTAITENNISENTEIGSSEILSDKPKRSSSLLNAKRTVSSFATILEPTRYPATSETSIESNKDDNTEAATNFSSAELFRFQRNRALQSPLLISNICGIGKPIDCPPTGRARIRNDWYAEVYFNPEYTTKNINGGNLPATYLNRKDSSESMRGGFTAGIGLSANIGEHLLIRTGIQYAQINERFAMRLENERRTITVVTTRPLVRAPGDTIYVSDTSTMQQIGYLTRKTQNRYRSIEIPLILGYEWGDEQIKFSINAGVIATATSWYSGEILDTTNQIVTLSSKGQSGIYQQQIGLSGFGSIRITKPIRPGIELYAEPFFRTNFSSMQIRQPAFTQRFSSAGLQLGIKWKLN